jgi:DNA processing protein
MANLKYFLWLTERKVFQPNELVELLAHFGTPEAVYFAQKEEYDLPELTDAKREALEDKSLDGAERILEDCDRLDIHITTIQDADYPERLGQIYDPPVVLYWKGKAPSVDDRLTIGVVGTRSCTPYGQELAGKLGLELARSGAVLVSGMAQGIDAAGIRGALQGGGTVISVLGNGLDVVYPKENRWLYQDVEAVGTLVSEYPPGAEPAAHHFPIRNRILSGLSMGVAVVEAGEPSGALITARHALEQNREVFAFPGPVGAPASLGTNRLIQRGEAKLILSAADILVEFAPLFPGEVEEVPPLDEESAQERLDAVKAPLPERKEREKPTKKTAPSEPSQEEKTEKELDKPPQRAYISLSDDPEAFTDDERDILMAIEKRSLTADDIAEAAQIPARRVLSALTMLQLRDMVEERPGKRFYAKVILQS